MLSIGRRGEFSKLRQRSSLEAGGLRRLSLDVERIASTGSSSTSRRGSTEIAPK